MATNTVEIAEQVAHATPLLENSNFWVAISFAIFVLVVYKAMRKAVLDAVDSRIAGIRKELEIAEQSRLEAQELLAHYQRRQRDAEKEAEQILANAETQAEAIRTKAMHDLEKDLARKEEWLANRLENVKQESERELRNYTADMIYQAAQTLATQVTSEKASNDLIAAGLKNLPSALK